MKKIIFLVSMILSMPLFAGDYIDYLPGDCPLLIEVPHDGSIIIDSIPLRVKTDDIKNFNTGRDTGTAALSREIVKLFKEKTGKTPYLIIMKVARKQIDVNRAEKEACDQPETIAVYREYYALLNKAKSEILSKFGKGLMLDIHCGGSWKYDIYFGTGTRDRTCAQFIKLHGKDALSGEYSIPSRMNRSGYQVPGFGAIPAEKGPVGTIINRLTWNSTDKRLDGIEIEIHLKRHLLNKEKINAFAASLTGAIISFASEYYLK